VHLRTSTHSPGKGTSLALCLSFPRPSRTRRRFSTASRGVAPPPRGISSAQRCECRVVHVLGRPFSCSHSHMRRPSEAVATPAAPPSRFASVRRSAVHPRARSPLVLTPVLLSTHTHPRTLRGRKPTTCASPPPSQRLQTSRRPAAVPTMISTSLCRSTLPCSFPSDPSNPVGTRKPRRGTCGLGATRPHHR
jgi:hypothetical protein